MTAAAVLLIAAALAGAARAGVPARQAGEARTLTTTGPLPPKSVEPAVGARRAVAAAGESVLPVPAYLWRDGCGPTATGMVLGYWDGRGFPDLVPGDASTDTPAAYQMIASHGTAGSPGHYDDYSLPEDDAGGLAPDRSEKPAGDEHPADSVADFMHTSWSAEGLPYGWSFTDMVGPAFAGYVELRLSGVTASYADYYYGSYGSASLTFTVLRQEIDAGRPMVLCVDSTGDGLIDHAVTGIGYRETSGYPEYACWDTWSRSVRWERFRVVSDAYAWGVDSATALSLDDSAAPPPEVDGTAPVTSVSGAGIGWSRTPVTLTFTATDAGSGVDRTEAALDGQLELSPLAGLPATLDVTGQGTHTVRYRSIDKDGNVETTQACTVRIDGEKPVTSARAASVRRGARVTLRYRVRDLTPTANVRLVVKTRSGRTRATLRLGRRGTNVLRAARWRCPLARGVYVVAVYATDEAGNRQARPGTARLTVR
ncbi:MAG TPA: hypothetical protein VFZ86_05885 [Thermoleophilia bacterium]|nr:hypothetical protein [Thermoleophilia bacterium]